jgi:hypothetical protein
MDAKLLIFFQKITTFIEKHTRLSSYDLAHIAQLLAMVITAVIVFQLVAIYQLNVFAEIMVVLFCITHAVSFLMLQLLTNKKILPQKLPISDYLLYSRDRKGDIFVILTMIIVTIFIIIIVGWRTYIDLIFLLIAWRVAGLMSSYFAWIYREKKITKIVH